MKSSRSLFVKLILFTVFSKELNAQPSINQTMPIDSIINNRWVLIRNTRNVLKNVFPFYNYPAQTFKQLYFDRLWFVLLQDNGVDTLGKHPIQLYRAKEFSTQQSFIWMEFFLLQVPPKWCMNWKDMYHFSMYNSNRDTLYFRRITNAE